MEMPTLLSDETSLKGPAWTRADSNSGTLSLRAAACPPALPPPSSLPAAGAPSSVLHLPAAWLCPRAFVRPSVPGPVSPPLADLGTVGRAGLWLVARDCAGSGLFNSKVRANLGWISASAQQ